ncbi:sigma-70 family RNA polymerase sigma factor [Streptomyces odontomachi]|uniref:sigma-70 family RNA polymerase sigma factor n=1 Tax=Streptomyces odontomachi TaxID=2944940 RepID=UPI00210A6537|nr:sigma-70 family RNA polymerase sigma factor [Streptomyces sp. ODS25]
MGDNGDGAGREALAARFEANRVHLRAVAYRMLGSLSEADDAVQEAWIRLGRSGADDIRNLTGWLTTVVGRICLDMLRARQSRREEPLDVRLPDPVVTVPDDEGDPEFQALTADSVGLALLVVLDTLGPAERLAYVLHDLFAVPFDAIAPIAGRTPTATRQLASRARRRIEQAAPVPDTDPARRHDAVDAFLTAARDGDFDALLALLDPEVTLRVDTGAAGSQLVRGAADVAGNAFSYRRLAVHARSVLVNGAPGLLAVVDDAPISVMSLTVGSAGKITGIHLIADPERLARLGIRG